jgi:glyoxylase-like metal-dependent hydrolase (beta-lactamase superfamily II)
VIWERAVAENAWEIEGGLYRVLLPLPFGVPFVNAYLVASRSEYLLIDCGANWLPSLRALGRALKAIGVPARGLTYLLLTHTHPDHSDAAGPVRERWGGRVLLNPAERPRESLAATDFVNWMAENGVDEAILGRAREPRREYPSGLPDEIEPLALDAPLVVGDCRFAVIPVPGHSPGQVMLQEPERGWLFTADHVLPYAAPNVWAFPGATGDPFGEYVASLDRTGHLTARLVLPSHGLPSRDNLPELATEMADFHRRLADRVRVALDGRRLTAWEVAKLLSPEPPADLGAARFVLAEALAVLIHLERQGDVRPSEDGRWALAGRGV